VKTTGSFLARASVLLIVFGSLAAACGRSELGDQIAVIEPGQEGGPDGISPVEGGPDGITPPNEGGVPEGGDDFRPPPHCGDHSCDDGETCSNCPQDCGLCPSCGDGKCDNGETCNSCPQDCGSCPDCPDGKCEASETCLSCPQDCGACATCGDGKCDAMEGENCHTCPQDCGTCSTCGNGMCDPGENCFNCSVDCGVCSFCGNGKCETDENCSNCPVDCGPCKTDVTCMEGVLCAFGDFMSLPPNIVGAIECISPVCPNGLLAAQNVVNCATEAFTDGKCGMGGDILTCITTVCATEIATCFDLGCTEM
jgi:hypothetical protein